MDASQTEMLRIRERFKAIREQLSQYMADRDFQMSNAQIFTFLSFAPTALAIASDGQVDEQEVRILAKIARNITVDDMVSMDLFEMLSLVPEPNELMLNEEFDMRAGAELLFLSRNLAKYEASFVAATKKLLEFDTNPESDRSMTKVFVNMMESMVANNASRNKEEELAKLQEFQKKLGLA